MSSSDSDDHGGPSQYHEGELAIQRAVNAIPAASELEGTIEHRLSGAANFRFLARLSMCVFGWFTNDVTAPVRIELLFGAPSFIDPSPDGNFICWNPAKMVPSSAAFVASLARAQPRAPVGCLFVDLQQRRRQRVNGTLDRIPGAPDGLLFARVRESFPNCPKYMHGYRVTVDPAPPRQRLSPPQSRRGHRPERVSSSRCSSESSSSSGEDDDDEVDADPTPGLCDAAFDVLESADTMFVATRHPDRGVDASHKAGPHGFVEVINGAALRFPDYVGNNMFCTFGNLHVDPAIAMAVVDWNARLVATITGTAKLRVHATDGGKSGGTMRWVDVAVGTSQVKPIPKGVHVEFTKGNELVDAIDRAARGN